MKLKASNVLNRLDCLIKRMVAWIKALFLLYINELLPSRSMSANSFGVKADIVEIGKMLLIVLVNKTLGPEKRLHLNK